MSISDEIRKSQRVRKTAGVYLGVSLFCCLFSFVYEQHSHGIYSAYMVYMFFFPLLGGAAPFAAIGLNHRLRFPGRFSRNAYHSGIAALTVGSALRGALEIYGTSSDYMAVYWIAGIALAVLGAFAYLFSVLHCRKKG